MKNFGRLKLELMQTGVYLSPENRTAKEVAGGFATGKTRDEIVLAFCEDFFVKTFLNRDENGPRLQIRDDGVSLLREKEPVTVEIIPPPMFLQSRMKKRDPVSHNVELDANCLNLFLRAAKNSTGFNLSQAEIIAVIHAAFAEGVADLVQLNLDHCREKDGGFSRLAPVIREIRKKFSTFISLRCFPPADKSVIDRVYASGIDLLNYPLEGFSGPETASSRQALNALQYAVGIFPPGAVSTEISPGTLSRLKDKIDFLTGNGIIPHIKLHPPKGKKMDFTRMQEVARHLSQAARRHNLTLKWLYPTCNFVTPLDAAFFTEAPETARLAVRPVYQSKLGRVATEGFAALRRKLRVRQISDSFESAGL